MPTCANCTADAVYTYVINPELLIQYCDDHLPNFLAGRKASGQLALVVPGLVEEPVVEEVVKPSKKKASEPVVEEPVVEPVVEETPAEETPTEE